MHRNPNETPTETSGTSAALATAYRCGWLRPAAGSRTCCLVLVSLLPAMVSLTLTLLTGWSATFGTVPSTTVSTMTSRPTGHKRRHEPYHVAIRTGRTLLHCILTVLLHSVKTIFSKSIKLFDVV
uniref:Uncharacterized protein n=1 Tax=Anopheles culicifacies TaxID=139723 RepID=A0A182M7P0_9DIPT